MIEMFLFFFFPFAHFIFLRYSLNIQIFLAGKFVSVSFPADWRDY
jgi:hypothetical protein